MSESDELPQIESLHIWDDVIDSRSFLDVLPWEDIIFKYIFPCLNVKELFQVRATCGLCHECVTEYFIKMKRLVICNMGPKFNSQMFHLITHNNSSLQTVVIRNSSGWIADECIIPVLEHNSGIKHADLSENTSLSDKSLQRLVVMSGRVLRTLVLRECAWLSSSMVTQVAINCPGLEKLDITGCWDVRDSSIINLSRICRRLKHLAVAKIYGLTDESISEVAKNLPELAHLNIQGCWRVTDKSVFLLTEYCTSLRVLQARECRDISMSGLQRMSERGVRVDLLYGQRKKLTAAHSKYIRQVKGLPM